jgi:hypothetical protein
MEVFWYIIAAALAGIGTGLVGLSAATVMVPILIVLCPSFAGETGAYQATAIALASDILGSLVTTITYIRHKNIDLKRGWIMFVCIISMCTLGSWAAWKAGNQVLGGFTLFLTFFIGIRFLVKPSTEREETEEKGKKLDWKGVLISIFFGLSIGFGTGFVGTGGGMMMLVVFTAFLGMDLKSAVGTSTFIMTFTALIGSVSHIAIHPAIVLDRWPVLLLCIVVTTFFSLVSARFANRVDSKTVGYVTGVLLTVMGACLIILHYWEFIQSVAWLKATILCFGKYLLYIIPAAVILLLLNFLIKIPRPVFRKLLHLIAFCSTPVIIYVADNWIAATLTLLLFATIVYPILTLAQKWPGFANLFVQKRPGEIRQSLLDLFITDAILVAVFWGGFHKSWIVTTAILMWGVGDALAGLIGQKYGKHRLLLPYASRKKSLEGSLAMFLSSWIAGVITLAMLSGMTPVWIILVSFITALAASYTELIAKKGEDTITVPVACSLVLFLFSFI